MALIPGLLMLATVGLGRLERWLADEPAPSAATSTTADRPQRRANTRPLMIETLTGDLESERLPTRLCTQTGTNPEFQATRQANRV
ncbi:hypothetical protein M1247_04070 [Mycobacterium sp. 21AC1]|nr:hypothetical protein [Mycobacterium sp. 21AC1]MDV3124078.1 hypothetical protein [Mycobacterium sp. 21AC1]